MNMAKESTSFWADIKKYEDILAHDPNSYCFTILSELYRKMGLFDEAINTANRGIDIHPDYIGGYMAVGRAYFDKGMKDEGKMALEHVVRVTPDNLLAQKLLMQIYIEEENIQAATRTLQVIELLNPEEVEIRQLFESHFQSVLMDDKACDLHSNATFEIEAEVGKAPGEFLVDDEITERGVTNEQSEVIFNSFDDQSDPLPTATLAELYVSQGYLDKAKDVYRDLLAKSPENEDYKIRLQELSLCLEESDEDGFLVENGTKGEQASFREKWEPYDYSYNTPRNVHVGGTEEMVLSILENWLGNIDRRRDANEGNTKKYC